MGGRLGTGLQGEGGHGGHEAVYERLGLQQGRGCGATPLLALGVPGCHLHGMHATWMENAGSQCALTGLQFHSVMLDIHLNASAGTPAHN